MSPGPRYSCTSIHAVAARQRKSRWDRGSDNIPGVQDRPSHASSKHSPGQGLAAPSSFLPPCTNLSGEVTSHEVCACLLLWDSSFSSHCAQGQP